MNEIPINGNTYAHIFSVHVCLIVAPIEAQMEAATRDIFNRCADCRGNVYVNISIDIYSS